MEALRMKTLISLLLLLQLVTACASGPSKSELDAEVKRLCAIDGGVKVYETVRLPADKFDELKRRNFVLPDKLAAKPTDEYYVETDRHFYRQGNPEMSRRQYKIIRSSDHKTLGELVFLWARWRGYTWPLAWVEFYMSRSNPSAF
jgi:hypothetical protein